MNSFVSATNSFAELPSSLAAPSSSPPTNSEHSWNEIRFAEMSGYDYIFLPEESISKIESAEKTQIFLEKIPALTHDDYSRCIIVGYKNNGALGLVTCRTDCECAGDLVISVSRQRLDNSPQQEFLQTLLDHSEFFFY